MIDGQSKIHLQEMDVIQRKMLTWAQLPPDCCSCPPCSWRWLCHWDWEPCCWSSSSLAGRGRRHSGNCSSLLLTLPPPERRHSGWLSPDSDSCGVGPQEDDEDSWRRGLEVSSAFRATHKISHRSTSNTGHGKSNQEITIHLRQPVTLAYSNQLVINFKKFTWTSVSHFLPGSTEWEFHHSCIKETKRQLLHVPRIHMEKTASLIRVEAKDWLGTLS